MQENVSYTQNLMALKLNTIIRVLLFFTFFFVSAKTTIPPKPHRFIRRFNVRSLGAVGKGSLEDDTQFVLNAWNKACQYEGHSGVEVPTGVFSVGPMILTGPCKGPIDFNLRGTLKAASTMDDQDHMISFRYIDRLTIYGGGTFDGQGPLAWSSTCSSPKAVNLRFDFVTNSSISDITSYNSKNFHINIFSCKYLRFDNMKILAPQESPNTDGIHLGYSDKIQIHNSVIATGDDCISIGPGSPNIDIFGIECGPGHGISIGSLGRYANDKDVEGITVRGCKLRGTQNGVRIKTWAPSAKLTVNNVTFDDIEMVNVNQPIIIHQNYCPHNQCDRRQSSQVQIKNVVFKNIRGTSSSPLAVSLNCSKIAPCQKVRLKDINLAAASNVVGSAMATCSHVKGSSTGIQNPRACI